jgi:hypothetical protein
MDPRCRACRTGSHHCHGTLIVHSHWRVECTDPDCTTPEVVTHEFTVDCVSVDCGCAQPIGSAEVFAS